MAFSTPSMARKRMALMHCVASSVDAGAMVVAAETRGEREERATPRAERTERTAEAELRADRELLREVTIGAILHNKDEV